MFILKAVILTVIVPSLLMFTLSSNVIKSTKTVAPQVTVVAHNG